MSASRAEQYLRTDSLQSELKNRTVRGGATTLLSQALRLILSFGSTAVAARLLTPGEYGLVAMATVITGFVTTINQMGLSFATIQRARITHRQVSTLFWANTGLGAAMTCVTLAISPLIAWFYSEPRVANIAAMLSLSFFISGLKVQHQALLNRQMRFQVSAVIDILSLVAGIAALLTMAWMGFSYWSIVSMQLAMPLTATAGVWIACGWRPGPPAKLQEVRSMLIFGGNVTGFHIVNYLSRNLDNLLIGRFFGPQQLGLYDKAYSLLMLPLTQINAPISAVAIPALSRLSSEKERLRVSYLRMVRMVCFIAMPFAAFVIASADWIVLSALGRQWIETATIFQWLGIAALTQPLSNTAGWLLIAQDRTNVHFRWGLVGSFLTILSIIAGLPWGPIGVAACYSISGLLIRTPLLFWFVSQPGSVTAGDMYRTSAPSFAASCASIAGMALLRPLVTGPGVFTNLVVSFAIVTGLYLMFQLVMPGGRRAFGEIREIFLTLVGDSRSGPPASARPHNVS